MARVRDFMDTHIIPAIPLYHTLAASIDRWAEIPPLFDALKASA